MNEPIGVICVTALAFTVGMSKGGRLLCRRSWRQRCFCRSISRPTSSASGLTAATTRRAISPSGGLAGVLVGWAIASRVSDIFVGARVIPYWQMRSFAAIDPKLPLLVLPLGILDTFAGAKLTRILSNALFFDSCRSL